MACCGATSKPTFVLSNTSFMTMPVPVTKEHAAQMAIDHGFTSCEELERYSKELARKKAGGKPANEYTERLQSYVNVYTELCSESKTS